MRFKDFEIRPVSKNAACNEFELVKWVNKKDCIPSNFCYVVAFIKYNGSYWELQSVGLRLMRDWVEGLNKWILAWCDMAIVCMEEDEDE